MDRYSVVAACSPHRTRMADQHIATIPTENLIYLANVELTGARIVTLAGPCSTLLMVLNSLPIGPPGQAAVQAGIIALRHQLT